MNNALESRIPSLTEDAAERRRLLNILAQRRYRKRKRSRLQELEAELRRAKQKSSQSGTRDDSTLSQANGASPSFVGDSEIDSIGSASSETHQPDRCILEKPLGDHSVGLVSDLNLEETVLGVCHASEQNESGIPIQDFSLPNPGASFDTTAEALSVGNFDPLPSSGASENQISSFKGFQGYAVWEQSPYPSLDFSDYAISTPGLSVIRAHVEIFRHLHGPNFYLDIWDPAALSPISLGFLANPCPPHYEPTQLQKFVQHHPIIDLLPWPSFRDRFLYVMSLPIELRPKIAQNDMASVTKEVMLAVKDAGGGLRVWGQNPFLTENWELGQTFYSKFWWAIDTEIVKWSNQIRAQRGETALRLCLPETA
ncbi:MAG: hypothetical protein FE78DRAFT_90641 [Acidomyces sp. 'richmondensis']|nr:MAG: hypothetical protein FE78DRAFT_90641 [Acidomyces sp. 'richmondensis']